MDNTILARATMGTSLGFHIVFAVLGVGLPLLMCVAEGLAIWRRDEAWMLLARRWSKAFGILFAVGAVSGTVLSFELVVITIGGLLLIPSLWLLFRVFKARNPQVRA